MPSVLSPRCLGLLVLLALAALPIAAQDRVDYRKQGKTETMVGEILESKLAALKMKSSDGKTIALIPAQDLLKVSYNFPAALKDEFNKVLAIEEKREYPAAVTAYKELAKKLTSPPPMNGSRFILTTVPF